MSQSALPPRRLTAFPGAQGAGEVGTPTKAGGGPGWVFACVLVQLASQLALLIEPLAPLRVFNRSAALGTSVAFLVLVPGKVRNWGLVRALGLGALAIETLAMFNPLGGSALSVIAHWTFNLAVMAPLLWVGRLNVPRGTVARVLLLLWGFHTLGSVIGVLQVYFPGHFEPAVASLTERRHLMIQLSSGEWMLRPTGLTDAPGGASFNGLYAALFGSGVVLARPFRFARTAGALSICLGLMCIYLSEVRSALVMLVVCFIVLTALLAMSGRASSATMFVLLVGIAALGVFYVALQVGGQMMSARLSSLIASDPGSVYYANRGRMLEYGFSELLPRYPLGAGLGHWGMLNAYFGSSDQEIGAEIQPVGWLLDGGLPLVVVYFAAVLAAIYYACRVSQRPEQADAVWASVVAAYSVGALALCFSYPLFMSTAGLEFWLTNTLLMQELPLFRRNRERVRFAG
jgi:hypothetical protein